MTATDGNDSAVIPPPAKRRRNAIKPNSTESDMLREFSMNYQMNSIQILENCSNDEEKESDNDEDDNGSENANENDNDEEDKSDDKKETALERIFPAPDPEHASEEVLIITDEPPVVAPILPQM